ncbi:hypothetical protein [Actinoplanes sp. NPDC049316]|uniref:hypothetical protein n=1 Tax=Actinoplanes sp. NPDC049316 TaxID=3154727 RepID=UPI00343B1F2E
MAIAAASRAAAQEGLPLNRVVIGRLVDAVVDGLAHRLLTRGFQLACDRAEEYIAEMDQYLLVPARRRAAAGLDAAGTLDTHLQYVQGMRDLHSGVRATLDRLARGSGSADGAGTAGSALIVEHLPRPLLRETT